MLSSRVLTSLVRSTSRPFSSVASTHNERVKTHILLLHEGFPRSEFYARKALSKEAKLFYNLPRKWNFDIPSWTIPKKVGRCMEEYGRHGDVQERVMVPLSQSLQSTLIRLMPELESVRVSCASPFESPTIHETVKSILESGVSRLIVMPFQPHFGCTRSGLLLNEVSRIVDTLTIPSSSGETRIVPFTATETTVSCIERWSTHPVISNLWSSRLEGLRPSLDDVLFVAPVLRGQGRRDYERSVYASAERTIAETRAPLPWRVAFFNGWNQWDIPVFENISIQLRHFKEKRVAIVPITNVIPSFDTISTLPHLLDGQANLQLLPPEVGPVLIQGMAELLKNHLLGRRSGQLQLQCTGCYRHDCQLTRSLLK